MAQIKIGINGFGRIPLHFAVAFGSARLDLLRSVRIGFDSAKYSISGFFELSGILESRTLMRMSTLPRLSFISLLVFAM